MTLVQVKSKSPNQISTRRPLNLGLKSRHKIYWQHQRLPVLAAVVVTTRDGKNGFRCRGCHWININQLSEEIFPSANVSIKWQMLKGKKRAELIHFTGPLPLTRVRKEKFREWITSVLVSPAERWAMDRLQQADNLIRACQLGRASEVLVLPAREEVNLSEEKLLELESKRLKVGRLRMKKSTMKSANGRIKFLLQQKSLSAKTKTKIRRIQDYEEGYFSLLSAYRNATNYSCIKANTLFRDAEKFFQNSRTQKRGEQPLDFRDKCSGTDLLLKSKAMRVLIHGVRKVDRRNIMGEIYTADRLIRNIENDQNLSSEESSRLMVDLLMSICRGYLAIDERAERKKSISKLDQLCAKMRKHHRALTVTIQVLHLKAWLAILEKKKERAETYLSAAADAIKMTDDDPEWGLVQTLLSQLYTRHF